MLAGISFRAAAQTNFWRSYDVDQNSDSGYNILTMNDGSYLVLVGALCNDELFTACWAIMRVDHEGGLQYKKVYNPHPESTWWTPAPSGFVRINNRYFVSGVITRQTLDYQVFLMEFNPDNGDSLAYMEQGGINGEYSVAAIAASDGNMVLIHNLEVGNSLIWLQKWSPDMDLIWEQYPESPFPWDSATSLVEMPNGDLVFTRKTCPYPTGCSKDALTISRTDSAGNELWTRTRPDRTSSNPISILHTGGDTLVVSWARDLWEELDSIIPFPPSVLWLDGAGEEIRRYDFPADSLRYIGRIIRARNGDILGTGYADRRSDGLSQVSGWVFRLSSQGTLLWERHIAPQNTHENTSRFHDLIENPDGSILLTGRLVDTFPNHVPRRFNPNVWLVRLDSAGCFEPGCGSTQLITEVQEVVLTEKARNVLVFPNPAGASFSLLMEGYSQPVHPVRAKMWDMQGRLLEERTVSAPSEIWYCEDRPPGVYWIQVHTSAGQVGVAKLVKR